MFIDDQSKIGINVKFNGNNIYIDKFSSIESNCTIEDNVRIAKYSSIRKNSRVISSFPPYSILQGNPAILIGFNNKIHEKKYDLKKIINQSSTSINECNYQKLGLKDSKIFVIENFLDSRGELSFGQYSKHIPFKPTRFFYIKEVPNNIMRGQHAHKVCQQFLIALNGSIDVFLDDGEDSILVNLNSSRLGLYIPKQIWGVQYSFTSDAILLVLASDNYDEFDYLNDYSEFKNFLIKK